MGNWKIELKRIKETYFENFWDFLFWLSLAGIFVWAVAKGLGWINTPFIIEIMPLLFGAFAVGRFFQDVKTFHREQQKFNHEIIPRIKRIEAWQSPK